MNTLEKLNDEIEKLHDVEDELFSILEFAGKDSETKYTPKRKKLYSDMELLWEALGTLLWNHKKTIDALEDALKPIFTMEEVAKKAGL